MQGCILTSEILIGIDFSSYNFLEDKYFFCTALTWNASRLTVHVHDVSIQLINRYSGAYFQQLSKLKVFATASLCEHKVIVSSNCLSCDLSKSSNYAWQLINPQLLSEGDANIL